MLHRTLFMIAITILSVLSGTFMLAITNNHPSIHLSSNAYVQSTSIHQTTPWTLDKDLRVIIPPSMILIGSSLLWCPNAKAGTTAVYDMLWKNKIISYTDANRKNETTSKKRCRSLPHVGYNKAKKLVLFQASFFCYCQKSIRSTQVCLRQQNTNRKDQSKRCRQPPSHKLLL